MRVPAGRSFGMAVTRRNVNRDRYALWASPKAYIKYGPHRSEVHTYAAEKFGGDPEVPLGSCFTRQEHLSDLPEPFAVTSTNPWPPRRAWQAYMIQLGTGFCNRQVSRVSWSTMTEMA